MTPNIPTIKELVKEVTKTAPQKERDLLVLDNLVIKEQTWVIQLEAKDG